LRTRHDYFDLKHLDFDVFVNPQTKYIDINAN